ncbi:MAG: hypothetical protein ACTSXZ_10965 [Alphaproteobacteria bacterium]
MRQPLLDLLRETYCGASYPAAQPFVDHFREKFGEGLQVIILYGSLVDPSLATATSFFDFYLIVDDYESVLPRRRDRWLAKILPPNIYYLELPGEGEQPLSCKYCVISIADLKEEVSDRAKDLYHLGRFSKRLALLWWRDEYDRDEALSACLKAMRTLTPHAINKVGNAFSLPELVRKALALSYEGEVRLEKTEEKIEALYRAAEDFYLQVWAELLEEYRQNNRDIFHEPGEEDEPGIIYLRRSPVARSRMFEDTRELIARSRRRAKARWPKGILLVDNWVNILLAKIERTYGVKIELTERERRWILILGWKHFFRLRREGKIR